MMGLLLLLLLDVDLLGKWVGNLFKVIEDGEERDENTHKYGRLKKQSSLLKMKWKCGKLSYRSAPYLNSLLNTYTSLFLLHANVFHIQYSEV